MIRIRRNSNHTEPIRPVVYGLAIYFLIGGMDSFRIGSIGSILKIVALLPLALALLDLKRLQIRMSATLVSQLLFWVLAVLSLFYTIHVNKTMASVQTLTLNLALVFCLGIMEQYNQREIAFLKRALLLEGWLTIILMVLFADLSADGRLTLLLGADNQNQNYINGYYLYTFSYHCYQLMMEKKKKHLLPTVFILSIVLFTGSRGSLISFAVVVFAHVCILFGNSPHKFRNIALVILLMIVLFAALDLVLAQMPESVAERFSWDHIAAKGGTGRTWTWKYLLRHFSQDSMLRMLFGHGYGTTVYVNTLYSRVAHNLYLDNLITLGVVGLLLQLMIQATVIWTLHKRRQFILLGTYYGLLGMCMSLSLVSYKPIWNVMLMALAIDTNSRIYPPASADQSIP